MVVVINTFAFNSENFDFMEIRRVADKGAGCVHLLIKTSSSAGASTNLNLNCSSVDEAVLIYLSVIRQLAAAKGRPVSEEFLIALESTVRESTSLSLGDPSSGGNLDLRGGPHSGETKGEDAAPATSSDPPSKEVTYAPGCSEEAAQASSEGDPQHSAEPGDERGPENTIGSV